jgi:hypothetical protein
MVTVFFIFTENLIILNYYIIVWVLQPKARNTLQGPENMSKLARIYRFFLLLLLGWLVLYTVLMMDVATAKEWSRKNERRKNE